MGKRKDTRKQSKRSDITIIVSGLTALGTIFSIFYSYQANKLSREANNIALQSQLPNILIQPLFTYKAYKDDYKRPCELSIGNSRWEIEYALSFDITNTGGSSLSLVDIQDTVVEPFLSHTNVTMNYEFFGTKETFDEWLEERPSPSSIFNSEQAYTKFEFSGVPISINAGDTRRLLIRGIETAIFGSELSPDDIQQSLVDVYWSAPIYFVFAGNIVKELSIPIIHPFQFDPRNLTLQQFEQCPQ